MVTDFQLRDQRPDYQARIQRWFEEANVQFAPTGIRWEPVLSGDAYPDTAPPSVSGSLISRRNFIEETAHHSTDVILAFSGQPDPDNDAGVLPFQRTAVVGLRAHDSDAVVISRVVRTLGNFFAAGGSSGMLVQTSSPESGLLDSAAIGLIRTLRAYPFAKGIDGLDRAWTRRAVAALEEAATERKQPSPAAIAHRTVARALAGARKHASAAEEYRAALAAEPGDAALRFEFAMELETDSQAELALAQLREVAKLDPDDARAHAAMGAILLNGRRTDEAVLELKAAVRLDPRNPDYQSILGQALSAETGRATEAAAAFETALRLRPADNGAQAGIDQASETLNRGKDLVRQGQALVAGAPSSAEARLRLGLAYASAGSIDSAEAEFRRVLQLDPRNGLAHLALARLAYLRGRYSEANQELETSRAAGLTPPLALVNAIERKLSQRP